MSRWIDNGIYTVLLGSQHAKGMPADLFRSNEARWLGIQVEAEPEPPRVLLVSVPYALKAADAETLGGKLASAFLFNCRKGQFFRSLRSKRQDERTVKRRAAETLLR